MLLFPPLPIDDILPELRQILSAQTRLVLEAPPGAGKTTRVPLALLDQPWLAGQRILMLEPRRLAARAAAQRMADSLGEAVGQTVGYRIRFEAKVSAATRITVVTEGILTRLLQTDPELAGIGLVIFDEFHERSLHADLGLALCCDSQNALRPDLKLLVMSATLDGDAVAQRLGDAPRLRSDGQGWPVQTRFLSRPAQPRLLSQAVADAVVQAAQADDGDLLVFLPGVGEITRTQSLLAERLPDCAVLPLYGEAPQAQQDQALRPSSRRKIILATALAETSLTFDGVRIVVDSGLMRVARFDPNAGMSRLVTLPVSRDRADQRRGRAGRQAPGVCWRLWSEAEDRALSPRTAPEIMVTDLTALALELALWGSNGDDLVWLDPPPAASLAQARSLLHDLGALDAQGRVTAHGRAMTDLGQHPRLAHMLLGANSQGLGGLACDLAAVLDGRDILKTTADTDLRRRLAVLRGEKDPQADPTRVAQARQTAKDLRRRLGVKNGADEALDRAGAVLALAYPDRVAQRRKGNAPRYLLSGGRGACLDELDRLAAEPWLVIADLDGQARESRIYRAAPLSEVEIEPLFADSMIRERVVTWDRRTEQVVAVQRQRLGAIVVKEQPLTTDPTEDARAAMLDGIRQMGLECLPWTPALRAWQARVEFLRREDAEGDWPAVTDAALLDTVDQWLASYLDGCLKRAHLAAINLGHALSGMLDWSAQQRLDRLAPTHITVPSGHRHSIDYGGATPVLSVRLQEMFGCATTPAVLDGRCPLVLELLSPAQRPVQTTRDLAGFWDKSYKAVKAELKGRYPKHAWPDDPLAAIATARTKMRHQP